MEIHDEPAGLFITWTVYGTFLQGDVRWWRKSNVGEPPQLEHHDVVLLNNDHGDAVQHAIEILLSRWAIAGVSPVMAA